MNRYLLIAGAAVLLVACNRTGGATSAATSDTATSSAATDPVALASSPSDADPPAKPAPAFVAEAGVADMFEIQAGEIALKKSKNGDIKSLAKATMDDRAKSADQMKSALKDSGRTDLAPPAELSEEKRAMINDLNTAPDAAFDAMYLAQQLIVHADDENLLTAYAGHGDVAQLRDFAGKTAPVVQKRLDKVHELQAKLAK